jgi:hypothetical protein
MTLIFLDLLCTCFVTDSKSGLMCYAFINQLCNVHALICYKVPNVYQKYFYQLWIKCLVNNNLSICNRDSMDMEARSHVLII